jgi:hypothetical protein
MTLKRRKRKKSSRSSRAKRLSLPRRKIKRRKGSKRPPHREKLTRRRRKIFFDALALGMTRKAACALSGISTRSFSKYMERGQDTTKTKYFNFRYRVKAIEANRELDALYVLSRAANGGYVVKKTKIKQVGIGNKVATVEHEHTETTLAPQWHAAAWFLERKNKGAWGRDKISEDRTAEDFAREIKDATDALFGGVPISETEQPLEDDNG